MFGLCCYEVDKWEQFSFVCSLSAIGLVRNTQKREKKLKMNGKNREKEIKMGEK